MDELSVFRRRHLGRALARARWTFEAQFEERIRARGFDDFRPSDIEIIARLPVQEGARITELAERAGTSKQAVGKLVQGLEARAYVERKPDPTDGRAQRIVLSARGRRFLDAALEEIAAIEEEWAEVLGARGLASLQRALLKVADTLGHEEYL
ncbi:MAG: MarR family transcriptional regulator [Myxococcota bacterium]